MTPRRRLLALLPGLAGHGGIQRQNRALCGVITGWAEEHDAALDVVSLADPSLWIDRRYVRRPVEGCEGRRYRFGISAGRSMLSRYDLLIVGVVDFGVLLAIHQLMRRRAPVLTVAHGIEVWKTLPLQQRWALACADRILSVSAYTAEVIADRHRIPAGRITVIPNPLSDEFTEGAEAFARSGRPPEPSDILCVARMNRVDIEKGIETLLRSVARLPMREDLRVILVGDGDDRPRLQALSEQLGLSGTVDFAGAVSDATLHAHLAGTRVFALPSRKEGFGIVYLEAMHYGVPVVGGVHGGIPEVIAHGKNGLMVPYGDEAALAESLTQLLSVEHAAAEMGIRGRQIVADRFGQAAFDRSVRALLDEMLAPRTTSSVRAV